MVKFFLRKPCYPLLLECDDGLKGVKNGASLTRLSKKLSFVGKDSYQVIDATGEGWTYLPEGDAISPLAIEKRWTKARIIELFNSFVPEDSEEQFVGRSLSSKKLSKLIEEIANFEIQRSS